MGTPKVVWDHGTAYDMMVSLAVLHSPADYGLRAAWAAGMRSRLPAAEREFLEQLAGAHALQTPLLWLHNLSEPKDGAALLRVLADTPAADRMSLISGNPYNDMPKLFDERFAAVRARGAWDADDLAAITQAAQETYPKFFHKAISQKDLDSIPVMLDWAADSAAYGERYLRAMQAYYEAFFAEEERRIAPALNTALERAHELAETMTVVELLEELSQGVRSEDVTHVAELALAPCYWTTPLIFFDKVGPDRMLVLFGARPDTDSLVPGEDVPDTLVRALKAISDPTRLRILRYLSNERLTPSQLARRLRLRPPTVIHHLQALRMARLVQLTVDEGKERVYSTRPKAMQDAFDLLGVFLRSDQAGETITRQSPPED